MDESVNNNASNVVNINNENIVSEEERKEEELRKTIKMEPILVTTELKEDEIVEKQKNKLKVKDFILIIIIILLLAALGYVITKII